MCCFHKTNINSRKRTYFLLIMKNACYNVSIPGTKKTYYVKNGGSS